MARTYTDDQRTDAVAAYLEHGLAEAHRRTGIPKNTLRSWLTQAGHDPAEIAGRAGAKTANATASRLANLERRRIDLAVGLMDDVHRLRDQLFAPCVERKAMIVSHGAEVGSGVEIVDIDRDQPTFRDQQTILTAVAIGIDKIQVLTGQPSAITETRSVDAVTAELERLSAALAEVPA